MTGVGNSVVMVLFDASHFGGKEHFLRESGKLAEFVRGTPCAEGVKEILLPGDPERKAKVQRQHSGISIPEGTWQQLIRLSEELGVPWKQN